VIVEVHPHAIERIEERGTNVEEVKDAVENGEVFPAKYGRTGFRKNFKYDNLWFGRHYKNKQVSVIAVKEGDAWMVITVIVKFF